MASGSDKHQPFPYLLSPIQIVAKRLRGRVLVTTHDIRLDDRPIPRPALHRLPSARARGGAGLQITGCTAIHHTEGLGASVSALSGRWIES